MERIKIHGHIGPSYVDGSGVLHEGIELADIITAAHGSQSPVLQFEVNSPGGYVETGDQIYDYLMSLKKEGKIIEMYQTGLIGSIATKIFMAGDVREVDPQFEFFIHNPWMVPDSGDADKLREQADGLEATEKALRKFYAEHTKITDEGLDALMKNETALTAEQAVKLGFATRIKSMAFALVTKNKKMAKQNEDKSTLKNEFMALVNKLFGEERPKGVKPKAQVPSNKTKSLVVELADGAGSFWVEGDEVKEEAGAFLLDESGQPTTEAVEDGDYMLADGTKVTIADGLVSAVVPADSEEDEEAGAMISKADAEKMVKDAVEKALSEKEKALSDAIAKVKEEATKETEAKILALKKDMKLGIQPKRAVFTTPDGKEFKPKSINQVMAEKREERKKQLNGIK